MWVWLLCTQLNRNKFLVEELTKTLSKDRSSLNSGVITVSIVHTHTCLRQGQRIVAPTQCLQVDQCCLVLQEPGSGQPTQRHQHDITEGRGRPQPSRVLAADSVLGVQNGFLWAWIVTRFCALVSCVQMIKVRTGYTPVEIFRKYLWYVLRERKFDQVRAMAVYSTHMCTHTHIHIHICTYTHTHTERQAHTQTHTHTHTLDV